MDIIIWIGLSQSLFAGLIIATKRKKSISDILLSAWLFTLGISFLLIGINNLILDRPLSINSFLLFNPAFYLYIKSLTKRKFQLKWIQLLHLLPFAFFQTIVYYKNFQLSSISFDFNNDTLVFTWIYGLAAILSWMVYNSLSLVMVHKHRKSLKNEFSTIEENEKIGWILFIAIFYVCFCLFLSIFGLSIILTGKDPQIIPNIIYPVILFLVYVLGYYGLKQKGIFGEPLPKEPTKYENSVLTAEKKSEIEKRIVHIFQTQKAYLNADFCLDLLAEQSGFPKHQITEVLNTEIKKNFFQLVNTYRVEEVKKHLTNKNNHYSIEAIGYDCGFNSKSSFYTIFKKTTGQTPSQYRNALK